MRFMNNLFEGIGAMMVAMLAIYLVVAFVLVYFAADAQGRRSGTRDPAIGGRIVTTFLLTIGFQAVLGGLALFLAGILDGHEMPTKLGIGLVVGGVLSSVFPLIVHKTKLTELSGGAADFVGRKALGINAILAGTVSTATLIGASVALVSGGDLEPMLLGPLIVYTVASIFVMLPLGKKPANA
jgi:hypothetical protein